MDLKVERYLSMKILKPKEGEYLKYLKYIISKEGVLKHLNISKGEIQNILDI